MREQGPVYTALSAVDGRALAIPEPGRPRESGCSVSGDSRNGCFLNPSSDKRRERRQTSFYCVALSRFTDAPFFTTN